MVVIDFFFNVHDYNIVTAAEYLNDLPPCCFLYIFAIVSR